MQKYNECEKAKFVILDNDIFSQEACEANFEKSCGVKSCSLEFYALINM